MLHIRNVRIDPGLVLAPMEGVTDVTFRRLIRQIGGCGLTVTEFIPARSLAIGDVKFLRMAEFDPDEQPVAIQIYGADPDVMAEAARVAEAKGAHILDLNMGCPSKKVCQNSGGSSLMKSVPEARRIVRAMRAAVSIPFTVKMRAGWDAGLRNAPEMARMCEDEGVEGVTVHWRTREDKYGGERDLGIIQDVVDAVSIPVLANGDIIDPRSARAALDETGCHGLMIGRGAIRNPWVFAQIDADMRGAPIPVVSVAERERVLVAYYNALRTIFRDDRGALGRMKKIAKYFTQGVPNGEILRDAIFYSTSVEQALERIGEFFHGLAEIEAGRPWEFSRVARPPKRRRGQPRV
ncbi:MAG: tRNA-dihydrouridine synthase B [Myxococcota bacterium]